MNFLVISIVLSVSEIVISFEQQANTEDRRSLNDETTVANNDSDDIAYIAPESVIKDALSESEFIRNAQEQGEEFLIAEPSNIDIEGLTKSGVDSSEHNAKKVADTYTRASSTQKSVDSPKEKSEGLEEDARKEEEDVNANINDFLKDVPNEAFNAVEEQNDMLEVRSAIDSENTKVEISRRVMPYEVLDSKARSGEEEELRNADLVNLLTNTFRMKLEPLDLFKIFPQLNTPVNRQIFHQFLSKQSLIQNNEQGQPLLNQPTPSFENNELTNQGFNRFDSYPTKNKFQNAYPLTQPNPSTQWPNVNPLPNAQNLYPKSTEVHPLNFNQNIPSESHFRQTFAPAFNSPSYNRYNSLYRPRINLM